ncbi:hypothetical protein [Synechococcus sp. CCFWC 502]|uniref:hypothetical protein n=1 Tax=unclassified Synechococcus TaxID=2626047 RepID=UPI0026193F18|nr:hypothetical protein [Synechococcus sp. CCFWC 502]WFN58655.1 hypothetical protein N4320_12780 [Synechococcus sp. CCFWC 502]
MASSTSDSVPASMGSYSLVPASNLVEEDGLRINGLVRILQRRQRIFLVTTIAFTIIAGVWTLVQRIQNPVFQGTFGMLISDPISNTAPTSTGLEPDSSIASVARNQRQNDVPTLIRVLESPAILEPVFSELRPRYPETEDPLIKISLKPPDSTERNPMET